MKGEAEEFKISFNSQIKRFPVPNTFWDLKALLAKAFSFNENLLGNKYEINYSDSDNDTISITSNFDYDQAKNYMKTSNLKIMKLAIVEARKASIGDFEIIQKEDYLKEENIENNYVNIENKNKKIEIEPKVYELLVDDLRNNFDLKKFSHQQILNALKQAKGDADLALQALFK
jgi:hypothetical protein